jgi:hypothetical protein
MITFNLKAILMNDQKARAWAEEYLISNGYEIQGLSKIVREMPWSKIISFPTSKGLIYFKEMAPVFAIEPMLIQFISQHISQNVPAIIAANSKLSCFLMKDAGRNLREHLKHDYQVNLLCDALKIYADIQLLSIVHINALLDRGVLDWRLTKLPGLYLELRSQEDSLKADGLTEAEIGILHELYPKVLASCHLLSEYGIPETIEHNDFHDNNILFHKRGIIISDWGDAYLSSIFLSSILSQ